MCDRDTLATECVTRVLGDLLRQKRIDDSLAVVKASSLTLNEAEFSFDPAVCTAYWDARRALIPMVGAVREVSSLV